MKNNISHKLIVLGLGLTALFSFSACQTVENEAPASLAVDSELTAHQKKEIAQKVLGEILTGIKENDYQLYIRHFTLEYREKVTLRKFKSINRKLMEDLGECNSREYLGHLDKKIMDVFLWKGRFKNKPDNELMIYLMLGEVKDKYLVLGFRIVNF